MFLINLWTFCLTFCKFPNPTCVSYFPLCNAGGSPYYLVYKHNGSDSLGGFFRVL